MNDQMAEAALGGESLLADLRRTFLFETFTDSQLAWVAEHGAVVRMPVGARLVSEGDPADAFYVLLEGQVQVLKVVGGEETVINTTEQPGVWMGAVPQAGFESSPIGVVVSRPSRLLRLAPEDVDQMLRAGFPLMPHLIAGVRGGAQNLEAIARQREKMAALGKLSAGLAHELNNPAAAASRAASQLRDAVADREARALAVGRLGLPAQAHAGPTQLLAGALARAAGAAPLDPLAQGDLEEELGEWLDGRGVADAWELAPTLASAGLDVAWLDAAADTVGPSALPTALPWLAAALTTDGLLRQVEASSARISELVRAIKEYTYMDQAPLQEVDLHEGLENTLTILRHRLRDIEVTRQYDRSLPRIPARGGELNQVWTNLIDNAADAMEGRGALRIRTALEGSRALVEIQDTGPGIPAEIQGRIWEPFFTTKGVGEGSGLGLDIAYRIVVRNHRGDIRVKSRPGETCFQVWLPTGGAED
jgi:signal transduction histidine kinase